MKRVYIAHPYTGDTEQNVAHAQKVFRELQAARQDIFYICLVGAIPDTGTYEEIMERCLCELDSCDELLLAGDWRKSKGCRKEYEYAEEMDIPIFVLGHGGKIMRISN